MFKTFMNHTKSLKWFYFGVSGLGIIVTLLGLAGPYLTGRIIDEITSGAAADIDRDTVTQLIVLIAVVQVVGGLINNLAGHIGDLLSIRLRKLLAESFYAKLMSLPQAYFDNHMTGELINKLTRSIEQLTSFVKMFTNSLMQMLLGSAISIVIIARYSWPTALLMAALYPGLILITQRTSKKWQVYQDKINSFSDLAGARFNEVVSQIKVVRVFQREGHEIKFFNRQYDQMVATTTPQSRLWNRDDFIRKIFIEGIFFGAIALLINQTVNGDFSVGVLVMLLQLTFQLRFPITGLSFFVDSFQRAKSGAKDYFEIMSIDEVEETNAEQITVANPQVTFDAVSFAYDKENVLDDVSFTLRPDTTTALIGESGSGKTTIASLLMMLYRATDGQITLGDHDVTQDNFTKLRSNISVVFQEPALFSGSIAENIAYGQPDASQEDIERAARDANAHDFIMKFDKGYKTAIGERGLKLSGGQKQRIAIARAILRDAPVLILDEATSSLDSRSERLIQDSLDRLMKGRTTLIIAHRLSTIAGVDQIITLDNGQVKEVGSPAELAKSGGIYQQLLDLQQGGSKSELKKFGLSNK